MSVAAGFKLHLDKERFLNNVYHDSSLPRKLDDVDTIISLKDLVAIAEREQAQDISFMPIKTSELIGTMRSVKDLYGTEVYANSKIGIEYSLGSNFAYSQAFIEVGKLFVNIPNMNKFFNSFEIPGICDAMPSFIKLEHDSEGYMAFYVPPVIEIADSSYMDEPLEHLKERAEKQPFISFKIFNAKDGSSLYTKFNLHDAVLAAESMRASGNGTMAVLRDGAHRAYVTSMAGARIPKIVISNSDAELKSVPVKVSDLLLVTEKPEKREDRFFGLHSRAGKEVGWLRLEEVGIDG